MPTYTVRREGTGSDLQIDTTHGWKVYPPSQPGAVVDIVTWGRPDSLTEREAREVAVQDFERRDVRSCRNCYFHGRRDDPTPCSRLCCAIRETGLAEGVELSPFVDKEPEPKDRTEEEPSCCALKMLVGWGLLALWLHSHVATLAVGLSALALKVVLLLVARWQRNSQPREPRAR